MAAFCEPCGRSFKDQGGLNQHLRTSTAHKKPTRKKAAQTTPQSQRLPPGILGQQQPGPSTAKTTTLAPNTSVVKNPTIKAISQEVTASRIELPPITLKQQPSFSRVTTTSTSYTHQIKNSATNAAPQDEDLSRVKLPHNPPKKQPNSSKVIATTSISHILQIKKPTIEANRDQNIPRSKLPPVTSKPQPLPFRVPETVSTSRAPVRNTPPIKSVTPIQQQQQQQQGRAQIIPTASVSNLNKPAINAVPPNAESPWSVILASENTLVFNALSAQCHSPEELESNGYITKPYNPLDYVNKRKCKRCNGSELKASHHPCTFHPSKRNKWNSKKPYKCCNSIEYKGCTTLPAHDFRLSLRAINHKDFHSTPAASVSAPKLRAVTLDCEMAGVASGDGEVILLCMTDYITGAIILNQFVNPPEPITQMRTSIHGISKAALDNAVSAGQTLSGWEGARAEVWRYVDDSTIIIGHSLEHDLSALRIIHTRIVDSSILTKNAVGIGRWRFGLQILCAELLNRGIRKNKTGIHNCLEDVLATREVVLFCTRNQEGLRSWAKAKRREEERRIARAKEIAREKKEEQKGKGKGKLVNSARSGGDNIII